MNIIQLRPSKVEPVFVDDTLQRLVDMTMRVNLVALDKALCNAQAKHGYELAASNCGLIRDRLHNALRDVREVL